MRFAYDIIVIDIELNAPNTPQEEIIELGAVKFLRQGDIHPIKFSKLILPTNPLSEDIIKLTGITEEEMISNGLPLIEVMQDFEKWAKSESQNIVLAAWGGDVPYLRQYLNQKGITWNFRGKNLDIKSMAVLLNTLYSMPVKSDGLGSIFKSWGMEFDTSLGQRHRALPDALNTALLLNKFMTNHKEQSEQVFKALKKVGISE